MTSSQSATPAFTRRAMVSDILTWNYTYKDRLELHLRHDRRFLQWMAAERLNAFFYIRHAHDTRYKIDQLEPDLKHHRITAEYGGHIIQQLLPRELYDSRPEMFPVGSDGNRARQGNLCVSNAAALQTVRDNALRYVSDNPDNPLIHVWGADVWKGAWCRCAKCAALSPQLQYIKVINSIAEAVGGSRGASPAVAYLAYHDTLAPDPALKPLPNVWFEWAPRERCYRHAIDDPACSRNPRLYQTLARYLELFEGRGHIFEYYADAILFGGLGFVTPAIIVRDLRAYHAIGLRSISCLTFGAYSTLAYPVNLLTFARAARNLSSDPGQTLLEAAAQDFPRHSREFAEACRAVERASKLVLNYGDVLRPVKLRDPAAKQRELGAAVECFDSAIKAAEFIAGESNMPRGSAIAGIWRYSRMTLAALKDYLVALDEQDAGLRQTKGEHAITLLQETLEEIRAIEVEQKGTWGAYDLEWIHPRLMENLRKRLIAGSKE